MSFYSHELNKDFDSKKELFASVKKAKSEIINLKKRQVQKSCEKGNGVQIAKGIKFLGAQKDLQLDDDYNYIAVNTTKILDSHKDLHINGIWNKTVKDQQGKNYLVTDHELTIANTVVKKENIEMFVAEIPFSSIGKNYLGSTQALIYKFKKSDVINETAKEWLESGDEIEASVRMQYVDIKLAMNSDDPEDEEEYKNYVQYVDQIANKAEVEEIEYFWVVKEAKNIAESSLVIAGSNSATGQVKVIEPQDSTQKSQSLKNTSKKTLDLNYIVEHLKN